MPMLQRSKLATIYNVVNGWYANVGAIQYIAHGITAGGAAHALGGALAIGAGGGGAANHPDQVYWSAARDVAIAAGVAAAGGAAAIVRIEIDCTLTPCAGNAMSCVYRVPQLINGKAGLAGKPLVIFSHRDEGMAGAGESTKRVFNCNAGDGNAALLAAYNNHRGWSWVPWAGNYTLVDV